MKDEMSSGNESRRVPDNEELEQVTGGASPNRRRVVEKVIEVAKREPEELDESGIAPVNSEPAKSKLIDSMIDKGYFTSRA